jgi:hypothetical protein
VNANMDDKMVNNLRKSEEITELWYLFFFPGPDMEKVAAPCSQKDVRPQKVNAYSY